jgi:hypothetical protein
MLAQIITVEAEAVVTRNGQPVSPDEAPEEGEQK